MRVFLSYRRDDSAGRAGRLFDALVQRLGPKSVFQDVTAIGPGRDFTEAIEQALADCDAVLVVIGPRWLDLAGASGRPRLDEPDDFVRLELAVALSLNVPVAPVLVGGAVLPTAAQLPGDLAALAHRQAVVLHDNTWHEDVEGLVRSLKGEPSVPAARRHRWVTVGAAVLAVVLVAGIAGFFLWGGGGGGSAAPDLPSCDPTDDASWIAFLAAEPTVVVLDSDEGTAEFRVTDGHYRPIAGTEDWEIVLRTVMKNIAQTDDGIHHGDWLYGPIEVGTFPVEDPTCFFAEVGIVESGQSSAAQVGFTVSEEPTAPLRLIVQASNNRAVIDLASS